MIFCSFSLGHFSRSGWGLKGGPGNGRFLIHSWSDWEGVEEIWWAQKRHQLSVSEFYDHSPLERFNQIHILLIFNVSFAGVDFGVVARDWCLVDSTVEFSCWMCLDDSWPKETKFNAFEMICEVDFSQQLTIIKARLCKILLKCYF